VNLAKSLDARREIALREVDRVEDDVLLTKDLGTLAEQIAERHILAPPRLRKAIIGLPRPTRMAVAGEPGSETPGGSPLVVPATRVDLYAPLEGIETLEFLTKGDGELDLAGAELDIGESQLVLAYVAEHPDAAVANRFFDSGLRRIESEIDDVRGQVDEFNERLAPVLGEALAQAKARAEERRGFAAKLQHPRPEEPWWGRP
jgi:hypothetical protein